MLGDPRRWLDKITIFGGEGDSTGILDFCVIPLGPYNKLALTALLPLILIGELAVVAAAHWLIVIWRGKEADFDDFPRRSYIRTATYLVLLSYTAVSQACFTYVSCT